MRYLFALTVLCLSLRPLPSLAQDCFTLDPREDAEQMIPACTAYLSNPHPAEDTAQAQMNLGLAHRALGDLAASETALKAALRTHPTPLAQRMLAWTYRQQQRYAKAERLYTQSLKAEAHFQGWLSRCVVRIDRKKFKSAAQDCEKALEMRNPNPDAMYFLARAYNEQGTPKRALPVAEKGVMYYPDQSRLLIELILAHDALGQVSKARDLAREGQKRFPFHSGLDAYLKQTRG